MLNKHFEFVKSSSKACKPSMASLMTETEGLLQYSMTVRRRFEFAGLWKIFFSMDRMLLMGETSSASALFASTARVVKSRSKSKRKGGW